MQTGRLLGRALSTLSSPILRRSIHASRPVLAKEMTVRDALNSAIVRNPALLRIFYRRMDSTLST